MPPATLWFTKRERNIISLSHRTSAQSQTVCLLASITPSWMHLISWSEHFHNKSYTMRLPGWPRWVTKPKVLSAIIKDKLRRPRRIVKCKWGASLNDMHEVPPTAANRGILYGSLAHPHSLLSSPGWRSSPFNLFRYCCGISLPRCISIIAVWIIVCNL